MRNVPLFGVIFFALPCRRHLVSAEQRAAEVGAAAPPDRGGEAQDGTDHGAAAREGRTGELELCS